MTPHEREAIEAVKRAAIGKGFDERVELAINLMRALGFTVDKSGSDRHLTRKASTPRPPRQPRRPRRR